MQNRVKKGKTEGNDGVKHQDSVHELESSKPVQRRKKTSAGCTMSENLNRISGSRRFGRCFGQNKEIVSAFSGSVVYFNVEIGLIFLGRSCSKRQELYLLRLFYEDIGLECR